MTPEAFQFAVKLLACGLGAFAFCGLSIVVAQELKSRRNRTDEIADWSDPTVPDPLRRHE